MPILSGVITPIGSPVKQDGSIDEPALRRLCQYLLKSGVSGILANGSMGGFAFFTDEQQIQVISTVADEIGNAIPVMGGLGETGTARAVRMAKAIAKTGVSHLTILPPFYFVANQQQLIAYFSEIAAAVDLPLFLYDNPTLTKSPIYPETVAHLRETIPHLVGIKESSENIYNLQRLIELNCGDDFTILTGSEFLIVVALQMGCSGCVGGLHNISPQIAVALYEAFRQGDVRRAMQLQRDLIATWQIFKYGSIWGAFDEALRYLGIAESATAAPYTTKLSAEDAAAVRAILDKQVRPYLKTVPWKDSSPLQRGAEIEICG